MRRFIDIIKETETPKLKLGSGMTTVDIDKNEVVPDEQEPKIIKIGQAGREERKVKLTAFMEDLYSKTHPHPFIRGQRLTGEPHAIIECDPFDGAISVKTIQALEPRKGAGTEAMNLVCALADKHGVRLTLTAMAYLKGPEKATRLSTSQLRSWYGRFGFYDDEDFEGDDRSGYDMIRDPSYS